MLSLLGLLVLGAALRRPPQEGPSLRSNVVWTGIGCLVVGVALIVLAIAVNSPARALLGLAGIIFLG